MAAVHPVTLYIRPAGPGDEDPLSQLAPDLSDALTPIVRREAGGLVFIVTAVDEPEEGDDPERSLGHGTPSWGAPGWGTPGWDEPSWTTSPPPGEGLAGAPRGYSEDRAVLDMERRASVVPQVVGLLHATTEDGLLTIRQRRLAPGYEIDAVHQRLEAYLGRFASTNRFRYPGEPARGSGA